MKTAKIVSIVCWMVTALILIGLVLWFLFGNLLGFRTGLNVNNPFGNISIDNVSGPFNVVGSYTVPIDGVDSIDVNWVAGEVSITPYSGDVIKLTEYARRDLKDNEKLVYSVNSGTLDVKYLSSTITINMMTTKKLELLVPEALANKLNELNVSATSADLNVSDFQTKSFEVHETSGDSDIANIKADSAYVHSVSGTINITAMTTSELDMATVSGEIILSEVTANTLLTHTTSGGQRLGGTFKDIDAGSISGEITISSSVNPDRINCGTTSGGIVVTIPGSSDLSVSYSTVSGKFSSDIPVRTGGLAAYNFSSVSGSIHLKAA